MARLSQDTLIRGFRLVSAGDAEGLDSWVRSNAPTVDPESAMREFRKCFSAGDHGRALRLFDAMFALYDAERERRAARRYLALVVVMMAGCVGGLGFLGWVILRILT